MPAVEMADLRSLFSERDFLTITSRVRLGLDEDAGFVAEDNDGGKYSYGSEGLPDPSPKISAQQLFGVRMK